MALDRICRRTGKAGRAESEPDPPDEECQGLGAPGRYGPGRAPALGRGGVKGNAEKPPAEPENKGSAGGSLYVLPLYRLPEVYPRRTTRTAGTVRTIHNIRTTSSSHSRSSYG